MKDKILKSFVYKLIVYKNALTKALKHLFKAQYYQRDVDYYEYINDSKQLHCPHKNLTKVSSTKFYCVDCGKTFNFVSEEIAFLSEIIGILLVGGLVYFLTKKRK